MVVKLDPKLVEDLAKIHCTMHEIASICKCSVDTLERKYAVVINRGRDHGKSSLRRAQFKKALEGNPAMLIWLGKHHLDQKESVQLLGTQEPEVRKLLQRWEDGRDLSTGAPFRVIRRRQEQELPQLQGSIQEEVVE